MGAICQEEPENPSVGCYHDHRLKWLPSGDVVRRGGEEPGKLALGCWHCHPHCRSQLQPSVGVMQSYENVVRNDAGETGQLVSGLPIDGE